MLDLHRHDEKSTFDGFGKPQELVKIAKKLGYNALGITNHGNTSSLVSHYFACKNVGIKPIMGCEGYFVPKFNNEKKSRGYHLCLHVKNLIGYKNLNKIQTEANRHSYYYHPVWDFELLEKYHEGLMCSSACVAGPLAYLIKNNEIEKAKKVIKKFLKIFGDDFYIEIMPYKLSEEGLQENININLIKLAKEFGIKCILTSDSHYGEKEDFDTYLKMHEIAGHLELGKEYSERYMPTEKEIIERFVKMHKNDFGKEKALKMAKSFIKNLNEIYEKVDDVILEDLDQSLPKLNEQIDSKKVLFENVKNGLKAKGKWNKKYFERAKKELEVICYHGFEDYFLMVQDYVGWAKKNNIEVGPGRGSVCNCLVAYALDITEVDSLLFNLDFRRFLRKDKKKLPDIDMDFETAYRGDVIEYLINKYEGHAARICSYGLYRVDNLLNDLFKVCGLKLPSKADKDFDQSVFNEIKERQIEIKKTVNKYIDTDSGDFDYESAQMDRKIIEYDSMYDNIIKHFSKLYKKIRYFGTHAAGVMITGNNINDYTSVDRRAKEQFTTAYDLIDIELINGVKFDMLGLKTMSVLKDLRNVCGRPHHFCEEYMDDEKIYKCFENGETDGIFQFESSSGKGILKEIEADCVDDVIAASALNRPGPLGLGMPSQYAASKKGEIESDEDREIKEVFNKYAADSYGCFVYQEQVMKICHYVSGMEWSDADKIMKMMKNNKTLTEKALKEYNEQHDKLEKLFVDGAVKNGYSREAALKIFDKLNVYTFNKGHAVGYALISIEQMWFKVNHPIEFWWATLKYTDDEELYKKEAEAIKQGCIIFPPHVNGEAHYSLVDIDGEKVIRKGLTSIKGVGLKAAEIIVEERKKNGPFEDVFDFEKRCKSRAVTTRVIDALEDAGALEFNKNKYYKAAQKYNISMLSRSK